MVWPPAHTDLTRLPNLPARGNMLLGRVFPEVILQLGRPCAPVGTGVCPV